MSKISEIVNDPHYAKTLITENEFLWSDGAPKDARALDEIQEEHYKTLAYNQPGYKYKKPHVVSGTHTGGEPVEIPHAKYAQENLELDEKNVGEHEESLVRKWAPKLEKINGIKPLLYREKVNLAKLFEWKVNSGIIGEEFTRFFDDLCVTVKSDHMEDILADDIINDIMNVIDKGASENESGDYDEKTDNLFKAVVTLGPNLPEQEVGPVEVKCNHDGCLTFDDVEFALLDEIEVKFPEESYPGQEVVGYMVKCSETGEWCPVLSESNTDGIEKAKAGDSGRYLVLPDAVYSITPECKLWMKMKEHGFISEDDDFDFEKMHEMVESMKGEV